MSLASKLRLTRAQWVKLIGDAQSLARLAQSGSDDASGRSATEATEAFRRELRGAEGKSFPDGERIASTGEIAEAFVHAGRAFAVASPERRSAIAPSLGALAALLDDFLTDLRTAEARPHHWMDRD